MFKSAGGFNNDWDLTSGLLLYLLSISGLPLLPRRERFSSIKPIVSYLQKKSSRSLQKPSFRFKRKHFYLFLEELKSFGGGLRGVHRILGTAWDGWVYRLGDLDQENLVKRIFQEIYLGEKFTVCYHLPSLFYKGKGFYLKEKTLIPRKILASLRKKMWMGIASGRPRFDAELALKRFGLRPYFNSVITLDECEEEENRILRSTGKKIKCSKPHPYSILRVVREIGISNPRCAYVGDVVDDILAAQAAKKALDIITIGFLGTPANRKVMKKAFIRVGADLIIQNPKELLRFAPPTHFLPLKGGRVRVGMY